MTGDAAERESSDEIGIWELSANGDTLILHPTLGRPTRLLFRDSGTLGPVDEAIEPASGYGLEPTGSYQPIEPRLFLRGKFAIIEDRGLFRECVTGRRMLVAEEGEYDLLEEEYLRFRKQYGEDLLASLRGRITRRTGSSGLGDQEILIVERMGFFWPVEVCGRWVSLARLRDSYWYLMRVRGKPVATPPGQREPYMRLAVETDRVEGFGGCSDFGGEFDVDGEGIRFENVTSAESACDDVEGTQRAFAEVLRSTTRWRIHGSLLEFYDDGGVMIAWFEPRFTNL